MKQRLVRAPSIGPPHHGEHRHDGGAAAIQADQPAAVKPGQAAQAWYAWPYYEALSLEEADRMINSVFDPEEVASERTVIISEREGNENEPLFRLEWTWR